MEAFGWDGVEERSDSMGAGKSDGSLFLKIEDKKEVDVVFIGEPVACQTCFVDGRSQPFTPELAARGEKPSNRVKMNVWNIKADSVQIWETSLSTFKAVISMRRKLGPEAFGRRIFNVSRQGTGKETRYLVMALGDISEDQARILATLTPHPLTESGAEQRQAARPVHEARAAVAEPVPGDVAKCLEEANNLPRTKVMKALSVFGLTKLSEVNASNAGGVYARLLEEKLGF